MAIKHEILNPWQHLAIERAIEIAIEAGTFEGRSGEALLKTVREAAEIRVSTIATDPLLTDTGRDGPGEEEIAAHKKSTETVYVTVGDAVIGTVVHQYDGWRFRSWTAAHQNGRVSRPTADAAIPRWARKTSTAIVRRSEFEAQQAAKRIA